MYRCFAAILMISGMVTWSESVRAEDSNILIFGETEPGEGSAAYNGVEALRRLGKERGWRVDVVGNGERITEASLQKYDAVVWLSRSGNTLTLEEQAAYEKFHRSGRGTVAIHAGGIAPEDGKWPWFRNLALARGVGAGVLQEVTLLNFSASHPASFTFPAFRRQTVEWYGLNQTPYTDATVLLAAYDPTLPSLYFPISWYREFDGGRFFYTMLGGRTQDYIDPRFLAHIAGGIGWATGRLPTHVSRMTDGDALILKEFDGVHPNGVWERQSPSPDFNYEVKSGELLMRDSSAISLANRHLVRRGISIDPKRPYAIEGSFTIPAPLDPKKPYSFCVNLNVAGADGDPSRVSTWSVNVHVLSSGRSVSKFMGFIKGGFFLIGQVENQWGEAGVEYHFEIHVNADLRGFPRDKMVSLRVSKGDAILEAFETDYSGFPYQPDYTKPVRFGLNGHGTAWTLRNMRIYYLDVPMPAS